MPITPEQILKIITTEDDFGFEMRVGNILRRIAGNEVRHGGTYLDRVMKKHRQFDYRSTLRKEVTGPKSRKAEILVLAVECKNLNPDYPLVVCRALRRDHEAFQDLVQSHFGMFQSSRRGVNAIGASSTTIRAHGTAGAYTAGDYVGKSLLRIKADSKGNPGPAADSDVYERWSQALSSSIDLAELACDHAAQLKVPCAVSAILPVVVVPNQALWSADYDDTGSILGNPRLVEGCEFYVERQMRLGRSELEHRFTASHIHFFSLSGFEGFLRAMDVGGTPWKRFFPVETEEFT